MIWILVIVIVIITLPLFIKYKDNLMPVWLKKRKDFDRIILEDALKHLYDCEYNNLDCSLNSLSGYLSIKGEQAAKLISRLEELNLVKSEEGKTTLTTEGKSYALRIIRIHRLWERYLADHTSVEETDWHRLAEEKEHVFNTDEIDRLAAKLGNPLRDPHGDPIPSSDGKIPLQKGIHLNDLPKGTYADILHIEDEPKEVYAEISSKKLYPGMQLNVIENSKERIIFSANGEEHSLVPIVASNITVSPVHEVDTVQENHERLSSLKIGDSAVIMGLSSALRGRMRRRLLDFGLVPGSKIKPVLTSVGDDPMAYEIRGTTIALRKNQSEHIYVKKIHGVDV